MLLLGNFETRRCRSQLTDNWPRPFRQSQFRDMPFWLMLDTEARLWAVVGKSSKKLSMLVKKDLLDYLLSSYCIRFALRMYQASREIVRSVVITPSPVTSSKKKAKCRSPIIRRRKHIPASLSSLPTELRMKIFAYATKGARMKVVGYLRGRDDSVYFKERDSCPVAMTCKQFHEEALEVYFDNLHVNLKATYPSEFSGDMSSFGSATFRDRIKSIEIGDWDETRRWRMCSAFKNARIELHHKYASDARKGAYYFG